MNPEDLHYTQSHEWVRIDGDVGTIGITDHAQKELGEIVYLELPEAGHLINGSEEFGTVESVKAVSEIFAPVSGEVLEVNATLAASPETINKDPYGEGWLLKIKLADTKDLDSLMTAAEYRKYIEEEAN